MRDYLHLLIPPPVLSRHLLLLILRLPRKGRRGRRHGALSFGQSKVKIYDRSRERITFGGGGGPGRAKQELVGDSLTFEEPCWHRKLGARIPQRGAAGGAARHR